MKMIVNKPFTLVRDDSTVVSYPAGECDMPDVDAMHWYTVIHAEAQKTKEVKGK